MLADVLVEVYRRGEWYVLLEKATATVNRLLRFSSKDKDLVYAPFAQEVDYILLSERRRLSTP